MQRVYLAPDAAALEAAGKTLAPQNWDLLRMADAGAPGQRLADFFRPTDPNALYLIDPAGNWVMVFSGLSDQDLFKDLKKILRFSQVG